ncbi:MAG: CRISPR-associated endonuclease Cas2 [Campylobacteraceae bacterium]
MKNDERRFMRLFVFFDLPTNTKKQRREATKFRNKLIGNGFMMLQFSVYVRLCKGQDIVDKNINYLMCELPSDGNIRVMQVTENQYERMILLLGEKREIEKKTTIKQLLLF